MVSKEEVRATIERLWSGIPEELRQLKQWVLVRTESGDDGRMTKVPYVASISTPKRASSTNPDDWDSFEVAIKALDNWGGRFDSVALAITEDDPFVFVDFDHVLEDGAITYPEVEKHVSNLASYTEVSLSGTGLHVITKATKNNDRCRSNEPFELEVYDHARFAVMTGNIWAKDHSEITEGQAALDELCHTYLWQSDPTAQSGSGGAIPKLTDDQVLSACQSMSKRKFPHLWAGEAGDYGNDESRADLALCSILARHSENSDQIDRLFRQSGLMREKWDSKRGASTYGRQTIKKALAGARACRPSRPTIILNKRQIDEVVNSSISALQQNSSRPIYVRGGALCEVRTDERGEVSVEELSVERLLGRLGECADWQAVDKKGKPTAKFPPTYLARVIAAKGDWPFPPLRGLSFGPYFRPDGSLVKEPGYDQASERYLHLRAPLGLGDIPESPSPAEVAEAVSVLDELLCDFPFADVASRASAFALLIQPCVRDVIDEVSPLALFDSPTPGSGKGLLCRCCSLIHTGVEPSFSPPPTEESEWKKTILSILLSGCPSIIFDNVEQLVKSASLCAVLTARSFSDRLLGKNLFLRCPNDTLWHITGNNIGVAPDLARRSFWIRLLPLTDRPQTRTDFLHPNLVSWVTENRSRILRAILILVRSWFAAGRPRPADPPIGGYVRWSNVIGGILEIAGIAGFLSNSDALWEEVNSESVAWIGFLEAWGNVWGSDPVTVKDLLETLEDMEDTFNGCVPDAVADALHGTTSTSKVSRLGKALTKMRDRRFGPHGFHLVKCRRGSRGAEWKVSADDASRIVAAKDVEFEALLSVPEADFTPMADDFDYVAQEEKKNDIVADLDAILAEIEDPL